MSSSSEVLPRVLSEAEKSTGKPVRCQHRDKCLVDITVDGIELQVSRKTWGLPCQYEITQDLMSCMQRLYWGGELTMSTNELDGLLTTLREL